MHLVQEVQRTLMTLPGVHTAEVSVVTGSVLVHYDVDRLSTWDLESLAPLLVLAEPLGISLDTLPMDDIQNWLHMTANGTKPLPPEVWGNSAGALVGGFSAGASQLLHSLGDVRNLLPLTLVFLGIRSFLVTEKLPFPSWYDYLWFAFGTYMALQPGRTAEPAP